MISEAITIVKEVLQKKYVEKAIGGRPRVEAIRKILELFEKTYGSGTVKLDLSDVVAVGNKLTKFVYRDREGVARCIICDMPVNLDPPELLKHFEELHFPVLKRILRL